MKTHTTAGEKLLTHAKAELGGSGYLNTAVEMAAYHHEWWNGRFMRLMSRCRLFWVNG